MLLTIVLLIIMFKIFLFALRASWGLLKIVFYILFLPAIIAYCILSGFIYIAIILLVIYGLKSFLFE